MEDDTVDGTLEYNHNYFFNVPISTKKYVRAKRTLRGMPLLHVPREEGSVPKQHYMLAVSMFHLNVEPGHRVMFPPSVSEHDFFYLNLPFVTLEYEIVSAYGDLQGMQKEFIRKLREKLGLITAIYEDMIYEDLNKKGFYIRKNDPKVLRSYTPSQLHRDIWAKFGQGESYPTIVNVGRVPDYDNDGLQTEQFHPLAYTITPTPGSQITRRFPIPKSVWSNYAAVASLHADWPLLLAWVLVSSGFIIVDTTAPITDDFEVVETDEPKVQYFDEVSIVTVATLASQGLEVRRKAVNVFLVNHIFTNNNAV